MHDTLFIVLKTKHNLSIFEPEIKNPLSIFEPVGQNEYAYKKKTCKLVIDKKQTRSIDHSFEVSEIITYDKL